MSKIDKATRILLAGFCINLCLGILYAWSVFNKGLVTEAGWSAAENNLHHGIELILVSRRHLNLQLPPLLKSEINLYPNMKSPEESSRGNLQCRPDMPQVLERLYRS